MNASMVASLVGGFLLLLGAPAGFDVRGAEVQVRRSGESATVRIVYDLAVKDPACGWFMAELEGLPGGAKAPAAVLILDGKEFPLEVEEPRGSKAEGTGEFTVHAFRESRVEGRSALEAAKTVQLVLDFPAAAVPGPEMSIPLVMPRSLHYREKGGKEPKAAFPRLSVRFDAEVEGAAAEVRATFRKVPAGARLVLRSDARSAGASVLE